MAESETVFVTALAIGALHGLEPGHGWTVAAAYALGTSRRWANGVAAGTLIGGAHLVSSFAVVAAFALLDRWLALTETPWAARVAGLVLVTMGLLQLFRTRSHTHTGHGHDLPAPEARNTEKAGLLGLAAFAFILGFAHEEEFAVLALCAGRASCWGVMGVYALTVWAMILALTLASIAAFERFYHRLEHWHDRLPRASAIILLGMGLLYLLGAL